MRRTAMQRASQRVSERRGPPWTWVDALLLLTVLATMLAAIFLPALLADIGDTPIGPVVYVPALGATISELIQVLLRAGLVLQVLWLLWHCREAPRAQRVAWMFVAVGIAMNYARNIYTGNPSTLSFELIQIPLLYLLKRLTARPTLWQRAVDAEARAERAEAELARLRSHP